MLLFKWYLINKEVIWGKQQALVVHFHCQLVLLQIVCRLLFDLQEVWGSIWLSLHMFIVFTCVQKKTCIGSLTLLVGFLYVLWHLNIIFLMLIVVDSPVDKSKRNVVEIKGRFSVTSENVDLAKVSELGGYWIQYFNMAQLSSISSRKFDKSLLSRFRTFQSAVSPASPQRWGHFYFGI